MKSPYGGRGTKKCCCCCNLDPDYTCYLIGVLCILLFVSGGFSSLNYRYPIEFGLSVFSFCYYLTAGLCLIIGTLNMNQQAKIVYCWMMLVGIILVLASLFFVVIAIVQNRRNYFHITPDKHEDKVILYVAFCIEYFVLLLFSLYTPCVVLGNLNTYRQPAE